MGRGAINTILPVIPVISSFVSGSTPEKLLGVNDAPVGELGLAICLVGWLMCRCVDATVGGVTQVRQRCFRKALFAADGLLDQREVRHSVLHSAWIPVA